MLKFLMRYFSTPSISLGFLSALCASAFIYLAHFHLQWPWIQALLGLSALAFWLTLPPRALFWSGFFTAAFWFWWIALSFRYYDLSWMMPFVVVAVALVYGLIFRVVAALPCPACRAVALGLIEFLHPFGFDWFRPALLFTDSVLGDRLWQFWGILLVLTIVLSFKRKARFTALGALILLYQPPERIPMPSYLKNIEAVQTRIPQEEKWRPENRNAVIRADFRAIETAVAQGKKAVILPESAFPIYLNLHVSLIERLISQSEKITILAGALYFDGKHPYNSAYLFRKGRMRVMHKVVLVPFGEASPLPAWIARWINRLFFGGAQDYATAPEPYDFTMLGLKWRNAICYEATSDRLFTDDPRRMVAISNNAWFVPSVQPTLQRLLMQLQADRHGTLILHVTNGPGTGVVLPHVGGLVVGQ